MNKGFLAPFPFALFLLLAAVALPAQADEDISRFFGTYVGSGNAENIARGDVEVRDLDVTITAHKDDGFVLKWITVVRGEDGARTGEDVKRREVEETFIPAKDRPNVFIPAPNGGLFQKAETPNPLDGEAARWAAIEGNAMTVYSLAISEGGGAELQVYRRALTEKGMDISYLRLHDEDVVLRMKGTLVRTQ